MVIPTAKKAIVIRNLTGADVHVSIDRGNEEGVKPHGGKRRHMQFDLSDGTESIKEYDVMQNCEHIQGNSAPTIIIDD